jgi:hypothetical protein
MYLWILIENILSVSIFETEEPGADTLQLARDYSGAAGQRAETLCGLTLRRLNSSEVSIKEFSMLYRPGLGGRSVCRPARITVQQRSTRG